MEASKFQMKEESSIMHFNLIYEYYLDP